MHEVIIIGSLVSSLPRSYEPFFIIKRITERGVYVWLCDVKCVREC
jgi:hypothetical protein